MKDLVFLVDWMMESVLLKVSITLSLLPLFLEANMDMAPAEDDSSLGSSKIKSAKKNTFN